jgi:hypothetical protein
MNAIEILATMVIGTMQVCAIVGMIAITTGCILLIFQAFKEEQL